MSIDYSEKIPNNVDLAGDRKLQRALESWQPNFITWWKTMGPAVPTEDVYLRTAVAVGREVDVVGDLLGVVDRHFTPACGRSRPCGPCRTGAVRLRGPRRSAG